MLYPNSAQAVGNTKMSEVDSLAYNTSKQRTKAKQGYGDKMKSWVYNTYRTAHSNLIISKTNMNLRTTPFFKASKIKEEQRTKLLHQTFVVDP